MTLNDMLMRQLESIYGVAQVESDIAQLADTLMAEMQLQTDAEAPPPNSNLWSERDAVLITYGDSIEQKTDGAVTEPPLQTLHAFFQQDIYDVFTSVHLLPFYPYSSDDGFAVINYAEVNQGLGSWQDVSSIAQRVRLMADLVINHCSSRSIWFDQFIRAEPPGCHYFKTAQPDTDLSAVVRPRTTPLLRETQTAEGVRYVWCTFSHDQVDFDFSNPDVLIEFVRIIRLYLDKGIRIFRLDAVAFLWKQEGTGCINLPQTHEIIRLLRTLIEHACSDAVIITETNIPNQENLSYFGNANEAHCIYNFSLPPLLLHTLLSGDSAHLKRWLMSMPPCQNGTAYFNFIASHDGIGLRPAEGLLSEKELNELVSSMLAFGGRLSLRTLDDGSTRPYEINIALYDALQGTHAGVDKWGYERFIAAHIIMLSLEGIPGFYIHSLFATPNDYQRLEHSQHNRHINRHRWALDQLQTLLRDKTTSHGRVYDRLLSLIRLRAQQKAFHPNATQYTLQLSDQLFGVWRQSQDRQQSIFCLTNVSAQPQAVALHQINLIATDQWQDLLSGETLADLQGERILQPYESVWWANH